MSPIPVPPGGPARYNLMHEDDIIATIPKLLEAASVPATTVNWASDQFVSIQEWCTYLGSLVGTEPTFEESDQALRGNPLDVTFMRELIGGPHCRLERRTPSNGDQIPPGFGRLIIATA